MGRCFQCLKHFWNFSSECPSGWSSHLPQCQHCLKSVALQSGLLYGNGQKSHGAKSGEHGGWSSFNIDYLTKNSRISTSKAGAMPWSKRPANVQVFSDDQPHVTLSIFPNNNASLLFNHVQQTQSEQFPCDEKTNKHFLQNFPTLFYATHRHSTFWYHEHHKALVNICWVSLTLLSNFAQNLMLVRCSNNLQLIFLLGRKHTFG